MLMKTMQVFLPELPKLELGDISTRANRLITWRTAVEQAIIPAGSHLRAWWRWCLNQAEIAYRAFLRARIQEREAIIPTAKLPTAWEQVDSWMRPKILEAAPKDIKDWVSMRARHGKVDDSHVVLFYLMKTFGPGSPEEKVQLNSNVLNPNVCSQPRAAQVDCSGGKRMSRGVQNCNVILLI